MIVVVIILVICVVMFFGSYSIRYSFYLKSLCSKYSSSSMNVAITFDDGVDPIMTPKVLEVLKKHDAKATFFIIGEKACLHPEIVKAIVDGGHAIGNHSYYHRGYFPMKRSVAMCLEIEMCSLVLKNATGLNIRLFRPPFGVTNPMVGSAVRQSGLISIGWSIRSLDTMGGDIAKISNRVTRKLKAGSVILLHDNLANSDILLDVILTQVRKRGLEPVTINELFGI